MLKLTHSSVEIKNFPEKTPLQGEGKREGNRMGREGEKRERGRNRGNGIGKGMGGKVIGEIRLRPQGRRI
jgi:hypothetical protein